MTDGYKVKKRGKIPLYCRKDYITEVEKQIINTNGKRKKQVWRFINCRNTHKTARIPKGEDVNYYREAPIFWN